MSQWLTDEDYERVRQLLIDADSMLSAYAYGREVTRDEARELSGRCREFYEKVLRPWVTP